MREKESNDYWASDEVEDNVSRKRLRAEYHDRACRSDKHEIPMIEDEEGKA